MSQQVDAGCKSFIADAAIPQFSRVIFESDGRVVVAGATDVGIGIAQTQAFAAGDSVSVKLWNSGGTFKMIASVAIVAAAGVFTGASGKLRAGTGTRIGQALEAASGDGSIIEVASEV